MVGGRWGRDSNIQILTVSSIIFLKGGNVLICQHYHFGSLHSVDLFLMCNLIIVFITLLISESSYVCLCSSDLIFWFIFMKSGFWLCGAKRINSYQLWCHRDNASWVAGCFSGESLYFGPGAFASWRARSQRCQPAVSAGSVGIQGETSLFQMPVLCVSHSTFVTSVGVTNVWGRCSSTLYM